MLITWELKAYENGIELGIEQTTVFFDGIFSTHTEYRIQHRILTKNKIACYSVYDIFSSSLVYCDGMEGNQTQKLEGHIKKYYDEPLKINIRQTAVKAQLSLLQGFAGLLTGCVLGLYLSTNHTADWSDFSKYSNSYDISRDHNNILTSVEFESNVSVSDLFRESPRKWDESLHISKPNSFGYQPSFTPFKKNEFDGDKTQTDNYSLCL